MTYVATKYNIWKTSSGSCLLPDGIGESKEKLLECEKVLHSFEAFSFGEALQKMNDYFGWGPYSFVLNPETNEPEPFYFEKTLQAEPNE